MKAQKLKSNLFLLAAALIWGFAFVAQRLSVDYIEPFTFNSIRFILGSISLLPLIFFMRKKKNHEPDNEKGKKNPLFAGILAGSVLFIGASLQQIGLIETTAGKAAFITGLYIVIVPILGIFLKQYVRLSTWMGVLVAIAGLYLLCVMEDFTISRGDLFELFGAFFWALHIIIIDRFSGEVDSLLLSCFQFLTCAMLSGAAALLFEDITIEGIVGAGVPILYGGICSVGIAYTLQVMGQKHAEPSHAAIILSMETVFASLGGFIILNENLGARGYMGCALMLLGMLLSQMQNFTRKESIAVNS
ncbi:putative inner membrane transporter yiJE [Oxobacter pfennigii]|uniref:Putative inner membrane transporter yiJE n=1 Tax=Oxobacter pfennigii TaxID=36849 RepID=A0A0P8W4B8_9CLOT|nr:DMT family transporter [Oxobacter pfennigii]KPU42313.1 putative inner membrane transporter yiJE [Oxobacter pfennigii]